MQHSSATLMHLLIRRISPYTQADRLLGVFRTLEQAQACRREYLVRVIHTTTDPWAKQAYHEVTDDDVLVLSDVRRLDVDENVERVLVVSAFSEGFGQILRSFEAIAGSDAVARRHAAELEAEDDGKFPYYCEVEELTVGELLLDA